MKITTSLIFAALALSQVHGALSVSQSDEEAPVIFFNGFGGNGFSGTLGNGLFSFDVNGGNLDILFSAGAAFGNNIVALYLDTKPGGFSDAMMSDTADGGRRVVSDLGLAGDEIFPMEMTGGLPDYGIAIGNFGTVLYELTSASLGFISFDPNPGVLSVSLATLGSPSTIDWFAALSSDTNFLSNESFPSDSILNTGDNPGFATTATYQNFNRFTVVPEPAVALPGSLGLLALLRRRR